MRYGQYQLMKSVVEKHNTGYAQGKYTFDLEVNHLADLVCAAHKVQVRSTA
jgi:hypothetical protein